MYLTRLWAPSRHSVLRIEEREDGKFALWVHGRTMGFFDKATIKNALSVFLRSPADDLALVQQMRNEMPHMQEQMRAEAAALLSSAVAEEVQ